jgi:hypothetical protein
MAHRRTRVAAIFYLASTAYPAAQILMLKQHSDLRSASPVWNSPTSETRSSCLGIVGRQVPGTKNIKRTEQSPSSPLP